MTARLSMMIALAGIVWTQAGPGQGVSARGTMSASAPAKEKKAPSVPWANPHGRMLITHYFNWFKTPEGRGGWHNWEWKGNGPKHDPEKILPNGRRDICSIYYPSIGPYDSADPDAIEYHMLSAKAAKIDGFFIDWYGIPSDEEKAFGPLLDQAQKLGFKMCICFEDKAMFGYYYKAKNREEAVENAIKNLNYILETHAKHPAYLKIDGKPVVINFSWSEPTSSVESQGFYAKEYKYILSRVREKHPVYFVHDYHGHVKEQYWEVSDNVYPWLDVNGEALDRFYAESVRQRDAGRIDSVAGLVYPGFDNTGVWGWGSGPFITPRQNGAFYERSWKKALPHDIKFLQIATWNDFGEGATIEPAVEYGFQYLELTEKNAALFKGVASDGGKALKLPLSIYQARQAIRKIRAEDAEYAAELDEQMGRILKDFLAGRIAGAEERLAEVRAELGIDQTKQETK
jgi:hypothetical protein